MSIAVIYDMAGHNNNDPGADGVNGRLEANETMQFRNILTAKIRPQYKVIEDKDPESLQQMYNRLKPGNGSVCVEWHFNKFNGTATGTEAFVDSDATALSRKMASEIVACISATLSITNRGVKDPSESKRGRLLMPRMRGTTCLVELCFIDNPKDMAAYDANRELLAERIARILEHYDDLL